MSAFDLGTKFEYVARAKGGELMTCVWIDPNGVHVNNPPKDSGFIHGQNMSEEEFVRRATAYLEKVGS